MAQEKVILDLEIEEIENAVRHLKRSNNEIMEFLNASEDKDKDFVDAFQENLEAIKIKEKKLAILLQKRNSQ